MSAKAPEVKVTLDKERYLRLNFFTMEFFQQKTGKDIFSVANVTPDGKLGMGISTIIDLTWALLADEDPDIERAQVARMIHHKNAEQLMEAYVKMCEDAAPKEVPKGKDAKN